MPVDRFFRFGESDSHVEGGKDAAIHRPGATAVWTKWDIQSISMLEKRTCH